MIGKYERVEQEKTSRFLPHVREMIAIGSFDENCKKKKNLKINRRKFRTTKIKFV